MIQRGLVVVLALMAALFGAVSALAQESSVFTVPAVPVYAEAETAAAAQSIAQNTGRKRAMDLLLRRLTAEDDWVYLPTLSTGQAAQMSFAVPEVSSDFGEFGEFEQDFGQAPTYVTKSAVVIDPAQLPQYEQGFAVFDEKTSPKTYRAKITYRFKPQAIRDLLQGASLPYSEAQAREAMIIPVLETDEGLYLWESNNPWARAWLSRSLVNELTPIVLPKGDRQDVEALTARQAKALNVNHLALLSDRYGVDQIILAHGRLKEQNGEFRLSVRLIDAFLTGRSAVTPVVPSNSGQLYDTADGFGSGGRVIQATYAEKGRVLAETFFRGAGDDFPALAQRAVESTVAQYARGWKSQTLVDHSAVRQLGLTAWFDNLDEWAGIRTALDKTPLVRDMDVGAFTKENAIIDLRIIGQQDQFVLAMRQASLSVWQGPSGGWNIASFDKAQDVQTRLEEIALRPQIEERESGFGILNRVRNRRQGPPLGANEEIPELPDDLFGDTPVALDTLEDITEDQEGEDGSDD